jgi:MoaA/NifB/PqqE/SkfB family radical SAM enzyme
VFFGRSKILSTPNRYKTSPSWALNGGNQAKRENIFYPKVPPISLELTNVCNLKCPYCANGTLTRKSGYIDWSLLDRIVDQCADGRHSIDWLHGTGEPLLWGRLEEVVRLIRSRNAGKAGFATNGTILHKQRVKSLLEAGLREIYVSIDSLNRDIYKSTRGGKLENVIRNVQNMIALVPEDFSITIALMNHKLQTISEADAIQFREIFGPRPKLVVVENGIIPSAREDYRSAPNKSATCATPGAFFFIGHDGRVALCSSDQDFMHVIGNVHFETIDEIWFRPENQTTFRNIRLGLAPCPDICTKHCHLKKPTSDIPNLAESFGTWWSFNDPRILRALTQVTEGAGWSVVEDWGTWSEGAEARLVIANSPAINTYLRFELEAANVLGPNGKQWITVLACGEPIERWAFTAADLPAIRSAIIPAAAVRGSGDLEITLKIDAPVTPRMLDPLSTDSRLLGIGVSRIRVAPSNGKVN